MSADTKRIEALEGEVAELKRLTSSQIVPTPSKKEPKRESVFRFLTPVRRVEGVPTGKWVVEQNGDFRVIENSVASGADLRPERGKRVYAHNAEVSLYEARKILSAGNEEFRIVRESFEDGRFMGREQMTLQQLEEIS